MTTSSTEKGSVQSSTKFLSCKPLCWFVFGGILAILGIFLLIGAIVIRVPVYNSFRSGLSRARFIDNTIDEGKSCESMFFGDRTCGKNQFEAWKLSTQETRDICMSNSEPKSDAIKGASFWCKEGEEHCDKKTNCPDGINFDYYVFSVENPQNILDKDEKPVFVEQRPVQIKQYTSMPPNVVNNETEKYWNEHGVSRYQQATENILRYPEDNDYLDSTLVNLPNFALFSEQVDPDSGMSVPVIDILELIASWKLIGMLSVSLNQFASNLKPLLTKYSIPTSLLSEGMPEQYFNGTSIPKLASHLGKLNVNPNELSLKTVLKAMSTDPEGSFLKFALSVLPGTVMSPFLSNDFNGCQKIAENNNGSCVIASEQRKSLGFTSEQTDRLWKIMTLGDAEEKVQQFAALQILTKCATDLNKILGHSKLNVELNEVQCRALKQQSRVSGVATLRQQTASTPGYAPGAGPFFVQMTLRQATSVNLNYTQGANSSMAPFHEPLLKVAMDLGIGANKNDVSDITSNQVSSKYGIKGLDYYSGAKNQSYSCLFDMDCIKQGIKDFNNPLMCTPGKDFCDPNFAQGYDTKFIPGSVLGATYGTEKYHKAGAEVALFVSDVYSVATLKNEAVDKDWKGVKTNQWKLSDVGFRYENCSADGTNGSPGIDCDSPQYMGNLAYFSAGKGVMSVRPQIYASLPYFSSFSSPIPADKKLIYNPADKIEFKKCTAKAGREHESCDGESASILVNEPITGAIIKATQRLQTNVRMRNFPTDDDIAMPLLWVNKNQAANDLNIDQLVKLQTAPKMLTNIFAICLGVGLALLLVGLFIIYRGIVVKRRLFSRSESGVQLQA